MCIGTLRGVWYQQLVPWYVTLFAILMTTFLSIQIGAGDINVAAVVIATIGLDVFRSKYH